MAQAEKVIVERVSGEEVEIVALELTPDEAESLLTLFRRVGGSPDKSRRGDIDSVYKALHHAGVKYDQSEVNRMSDSIYFSEM